MKKSTLPLITTIALLTGFLSFAQQELPKSGPNHLGTWQLVSGKYNGQDYSIPAWRTPREDHHCDSLHVGDLR
jgi:hypothetical protein